MNFKPRMLARALVYSCLLCTALGAAAQSQQAQTETELLRQALGDPQQRARIRAERIQHARTARPDLATVLHLDARTEEQLFSLLADHQLSIELQAQTDPSMLAVPLPRSNPLVQRAQEYTQRMRDVGRILGEEKLEAYVNYMKTLMERYRLRDLDSEMPTHAKLTAAQKEALVAVYREHMLRDDVPWHEQYSDPTFPVQESLLLEAALMRIERGYLAMVAQVTPLLNSEQARVFSAEAQTVLNQLREARQGEHKAHGAASDEALPSLDPPPLLTDTVRLRIDIEFNGSKRIETLTSGRGIAMSFEGPDGLRVQATPYRLYRNVMLLELSFFETTRNTQRLLGRGRLTREIGSPNRLEMAASGDATQFLEGRRGYGVVWNFSATYD